MNADVGLDEVLCMMQVPASRKANRSATAVFDFADLGVFRLILDQNGRARRNFPLGVDRVLYLRLKNWGVRVSSVGISPASCHTGYAALCLRIWTIIFDTSFYPTTISTPSQALRSYKPLFEALALTEIVWQSKYDILHGNTMNQNSVPKALNLAPLSAPDLQPAVCVDDASLLFTRQTRIAPNSTRGSDVLQGSEPSYSTRWAKSFPTVVASSLVQYSCLLCNKAYRRKCDLKLVPDSIKLNGVNISQSSQ